MAPANEAIWAQETGLEKLSVKHEGETIEPLVEIGEPVELGAVNPPPPPQAEIRRAVPSAATADRIRDQLAAQGIKLLDTKDGVRWTRD